MAKIQLPHSGKPTPVIDLIAFLAILALIGVAMALGNTTATSLGAVCAALGSLYAVYKWPRSPGGPSGGDDRKPDQLPPA